MAHANIHRLLLLLMAVVLVVVASLASRTLAKPRRPDEVRRAQNAGRRAQNAGRRTQNAGRREQNVGRREQNAGRREQNAGRRAQSEVQGAQKDALNEDAKVKDGSVTAEQCQLFGKNSCSTCTSIPGCAWCLSKKRCSRDARFVCDGLDDHVGKLEGARGICPRDPGGWKDPARARRTFELPAQLAPACFAQMKRKTCPAPRLDFRLAAAYQLRANAHRRKYTEILSDSSLSGHNTHTKARLRAFLLAEIISPSSRTVCPLGSDRSRVCVANEDGIYGGYLTAVAAQLRASWRRHFREYKRREMLAKKKKHLRLFIQGLDINKDSQLDPSEVQWLKPKRNRSEGSNSPGVTVIRDWPGWEEMFDQHDGNRDGKLDAHELTSSKILSSANATGEWQPHVPSTDQSYSNAGLVCFPGKGADELREDWSGQRVPRSILDRCDIDTMDASEVTPETLLRYLQHKQALRITNYIEKMPGSDGWADARWKWTRSNLTKLYGNVDLDIGFKPPRMPFSTTVKDYLKYTTRCMKHKLGGAKVCEPPLYAWDSRGQHQVDGWHPLQDAAEPSLLAALEDYRTTSYPHPTSANASEHHYRHTFILGTACSGTHLHEHGHAWTVLVHGLKHWAFASKEIVNREPWLQDVERVQELPAADWFYRFVHNETTLGKRASPEPDLGLPRSLLQCTQHPGDLIYVPQQWHHGVVNLWDSVSVADEFATTSLRSFEDMPPIGGLS